MDSSASVSGLSSEDLPKPLALGRESVHLCSRGHPCPSSHGPCRTQLLPRGTSAGLCSSLCGHVSAFQVSTWQPWSPQPTRILSSVPLPLRGPPLTGVLWDVMQPGVRGALGYQLGHLRCSSHLPHAPQDSPQMHPFSSVGKALLLAHLSAFLTCLGQEGESSSPPSWWLETRIRPTRGGWLKHGLFASVQAEHLALPPPATPSP